MQACLFERLDISKILCASTGALVPQEAIAPEERNGNAEHLAVEAVPPRFIEGQTADPCEDIDAVRRQAKLRHSVRSSKVLAPNSEGIEWCTKVSEGVPNVSGILFRRVDPEVEITRGPWDSVSGQRVRPDDDKTDAGVYERQQNVTKVVGHRARLNAVLLFAKGRKPEGNIPSGIGRERPLG